MASSLLLLVAGVALLASRATAVRENIVFILTDDQDIELNERLDSPLGPMRHTKTLMQQAGALGTHSYVNVPICCPSRSNILSGRYAHNIRDNHYEPFPPAGTDASGLPGHSCGDEPIEKVTCEPASPKCLPCGCMRMNVSSLGEFPEQTYPVYLKRAGSCGLTEAAAANAHCNADTTAYFGKYLNPPAMTKYCRNETLGPLTGGWPSGWDTFYGMCDQASTPEGAYYDVNWVDSVAGEITHTGTKPEEYTTSVIGNKTVNWIHENAKRDEPFFVAAATRAPHAPYLPPPWCAPRAVSRYRQEFEGIKSPRNLGSYNHTTEGKPAWMAANLPLNTADADHFDEVMRLRWGALLAVDDLVEGVITALDAVGVLNQTFVFYWSDHGYHLGSFRLAEGKMHFYEFDTRVPFLVRGPGIPQGFNLDKLIGNIDLAPTFLAIAGIDTTSVHPVMDGRSILPLVTAPASTNGKSTSDTASPIELETRDRNPPKACSPDPCNGHGVCLEPLNPQCFCNQQYTGSRCERCSAGHENYPACTEVPWREKYLFEYYPIQNFETAAQIAAGARVNDSPDNTFRALRIHNDTHDMVYAEVTTLKDWFFEAVLHYELYDMRTDPFQLNNIYETVSTATLKELHTDLLQLYGCEGSACP